jgi:hypothetical protein
MPYFTLTMPRKESPNTRAKPGNLMTLKKSEKVRHPRRNTRPDNGYFIDIIHVTPSSLWERGRG